MMPLRGVPLEVSFVTRLKNMMRDDTNYRSWLDPLDPRHSLVARIIWLVIALAASFAVAASVWVGNTAREIVVQQHIRRLVLETAQLSADLGQAVNSRLDALRSARLAPNGGTPSTAQCRIDLPAHYRRLRATFPDLEWTAAADLEGTVVGSSNNSLPVGSRVAQQAWYSGGLHGPWIGYVKDLAPTAEDAPLGDLAAPFIDACDHTIGVVLMRLHWNWASNDAQHISDALNPGKQAHTLIVDELNVVRVGPEELMDKPWPGVFAENGLLDGATPRFERLPGGSVVLVARATPQIADRFAQLGWQVQLTEPKAMVFQRADALAHRIVWISTVLGVLTALLGAMIARHITSRLRGLTRSAAALGRNAAPRIEVPSGRDEVAQLAGAFAQVLDDLHRDRTELLALSEQLERRVAARTREIERLAEESRYAAVVRERLKIARDLHDTLAHSMMAMLSEVRLLRKLQARNPEALADELARAEAVAHDGLNAARSAITHMRLNAVRDTGLGAALATAFDRFIDHTGLRGEFHASPEAAGFGDERAETLFRMAEEALRNVERHARASHVRMSLTEQPNAVIELAIIDDGIGFDPSQPAPPGHFGLTGLREQAQLIDAELCIESSAGRGTRVAIALRIRPPLT